MDIDQRTTYAAGQINSAFSFDGVDDRVQAGRLAEPGAMTHSMTIEAWVRVDGFPTGKTPWGEILFRGDDRGGLDPYQLAVTPGGILSFQINSLTA